jgi:hypothetical protein
LWPPLKIINDSGAIINHGIMKTAQIESTIILGASSARRS